MQDAMVIVGAGHVGGRTALALRANGWNGPIVLVGDEVDAPYERPPLSKGVLTGEAFSASLRPDADYAHQGIEWLRSTSARRIVRDERAVVLADGRRIAYQSLLLATGGRARPLTVPGADLPVVTTLRTLPDARALAARLAAGARCLVVGGGFIGLEVAASARARGCDVTLLEAAPRLLGRVVPAAIAERVQSLHQAHGVDMRLGAELRSVTQRGAVSRVRLGDGSMLDVDVVVVGIGIVPNVALAESAGLSVGNGIVVDRHLRTTDLAIYAAGDVALFPDLHSGQPRRRESWHNAEDHARVAAANMVGGHERAGGPHWFWSDQYDHTLQISGDPSAGNGLVSRQVGEHARIDFHLDAGERIVGIAGFGPTTALAKEFKLARTLYERGIRPAAGRLADTSASLKSLLACA